MCYRGKGTSQTKVAKNGKPKHAGNFSYQTIHYQSLQSKDYRVRLVKGHLIVGEHMPLLALLPSSAVELAMNDDNFDSYMRKGYKWIKGEKCEIHQHLYRVFSRSSIIGCSFIYRVDVYTDGKIDFSFPEY